MQQHKHSGHLRRWSIARPSVSVLLGAVALLAMLVVASWGSAHAAPLAGGPTLTIVSISNNTLTLQFDNWTQNQSLTLSYSLSKTCSPGTPLPAPTFKVTTDSFETPYTLPGGIKTGSYFLCATDSLDGTNASTNTFVIQNDGSVQPTPGTPGPTPTSASSPGAHGSPTATSTPGNQGVSATNQNTNSVGNTLVAIILLCLLVMALLAYLIRLWLQGRQTGGQPPAP